MPEGWRPPTVEELMFEADEVLYGYVGRTIPNEDNGPHANLYTATVRVLCIYKGRRPTHSVFVNITDVGRFCRLALYR